MAGSGERKAPVSRSRLPAPRSPFTIEAVDNTSRARAGILKTPHGEIQTPVFMPVGTQATVKTIANNELTGAGAQVILGNAYHLYLRPGVELIQKAGGLHRFMSWGKPILTDSGGYQIFSLKEKKKINDDGLCFKSHLDGSAHFFTPEKVMEIQDALGSDILMPLDQFTAYPADKSQVREAAVRTLLWMKRSIRAWQERKNRESLLFPIIQGGIFSDLRRQSTEEMISMNLSGTAIGGLSVGEPKERMLEILEEIVPLLPDQKPRYLMGVGYPQDLIEAVERGVDMFDCVVPTRNGRNGTVFYSGGKLLLGNAEFAQDFRPIDERCTCFTCQHHTRAYLRHLFNAKEMLGLRLASLHNVTFFIQLLQQIRASILEGRFSDYKTQFYKRLNIRN